MRALTLNQLDYYFGKPWASPEEELYPVTGEALRFWAKGNLPRYEKVSIVAPHDHPGAHELRDILERNGVATGLYAVGSTEAQAIVERHAPGVDRFPILVLYDGRVLVDPRHHEVAQAMGAQTEPDDTLYDVTIVGAGPAGLSAAVYAASEGLSTCVIEPGVVGGQASMSSMIRNYFGFPWGIAGSDLTERGEQQATARSRRGCRATWSMRSKPTDASPYVCTRGSHEPWGTTGSKPSSSALAGSPRGARRGAIRTSRPPADAVADRRRLVRRGPRLPRPRQHPARAVLTATRC